MLLKTTNSYEWRQVSISERSKGTHTGRRAGRCRGAEGIGFNADCIANPFPAVISTIVPIFDNRH